MSHLLDELENLARALGWLGGLLYVLDLSYAQVRAFVFARRRARFLRDYPPPVMASPSFPPGPIPKPGGRIPMPSGQEYKP